MNQSKTILHFLKTGNYSGAENVAVTIIVEMRKRFNYRGVYVSLPGDIDVVLEKEEIEHAVVTANNKNEYQRVIDQYHPDIIHAHDFGTSAVLSRIKSPAHKISHLHNNPPWIRNINAKSLAYLLASIKYDKILAVSDSIFDEYVFAKAIMKKGCVIGNPINANKIKERAKEADEYVESDVLFLGRFSPQKNPLRFLDIIDECRKSKNYIRAVMIGKGELRGEVEDAIHRKKLEDNVKVLGFKSNPYGYLKHTKVLCVPSDWEGFGLVIVEAYALGIPVVGTPVGGMKDLVTAETGALCRKENEFKDEIIRLVTDDEYHAMKSQAAYVKAAELDNVEQYIDNVHECYSSIYDDMKCF